MVAENHFVHLEDNRFKTVRKFKKRDVPHQLHWYLKQDYFSEELLGIYRFEVEAYQKLCKQAFEISLQATQKILDEKRLALFDIPPYFEACIYHSWENRTKHPYLCGRFDVNGGLGSKDPKIIEFNADTCSTFPETILWQNIQFNALPQGNRQFNDLAMSLGRILATLKATFTHDETPYILGSSFGYKEDVLNVNSILDIAHDQNYKTFYTDLQNVVFSHENGILHEINGEYQIADVWFKMIPWDWMFTDEPDLAKDLSAIITKDLCTVLNPAYAAIWQNKKFLAYITTYFPNKVFAETFTGKPILEQYVTKPIYGRLGENIDVHAFKSATSKGDYANQEKVYQKYYPLDKDKEQYFYQPGIFYTDKPAALNLRAQESQIITDDCEFMSHFII